MNYQQKVTTLLSLRGDGPALPGKDRISQLQAEVEEKNSRSAKSRRCSA